MVSCILLTNRGRVGARCEPGVVAHTACSNAEASVQHCASSHEIKSQTLQSQSSFKGGTLAVGVTTLLFHYVVKLKTAHKAYRLANVR